jgi:hypothetical protein
VIILAKLLKIKIMKKKLKTLFTLFILTATFSVSFAAIEQKSNASQAAKASTDVFTHQKNLRTMTIADYEKLSGKKMGLISKVQFKVAQKFATKKAETEKSDKKTFSLISLIAGGISLITTIIFPFVGLLLALAGLIFGIIGLKKEKAQTMSILGIVFGGLTLLLILVFVVLIASISFV